MAGHSEQTKAPRLEQAWQLSEVGVAELSGRAEWGNEAREVAGSQVSWGLVGHVRALSSSSSVSPGATGQEVNSLLQRIGPPSSCGCPSVNSLCGQNLWFPALQTQPSFSVPIRERDCIHCWKTLLTLLCASQGWVEGQEQDLG